MIEGTAADLVKSKPELIAENALLRQQLMALKRYVKQPKFSPRDRGVGKPETLLKWHRQGFKLFWWYQSKGIARQPRLSEETITLIQKMAVENRRWGAKRIRDELLKLGIRVNKGTIRHYMGQARRKLPPQHHGQTGSTFLANHASEIWACDFVQTYDVFFRTIFPFFIIEHGSRRVVHADVTRAPSDAWVAQQLWEATPFGELDLRP